MWGDLSKAQEMHFSELREITRKNYVYFTAKKLTRGDLRSLLVFIWKHIPFYPDAGCLKVETWRRVGWVLHKNPRASAHILTSWRAVLEALKTQEQILLKILLNPLNYNEVQLLPPASETPVTIKNHSKVFPSNVELCDPPALTKTSNFIQETLQNDYETGELNAEEMASLYPVTIGVDAQMKPAREVNKIIVPMGPLQCGLPNPNLIPQTWDLVIIDLKDCFFSIPLFPEDRKLFAFTLPSINNSASATRYQWTVLPQGMLNSPTMCQMYVDLALQPFRKLHINWKIYHYMDDILIAGPGPKGTIMASYKELETTLARAGLVISPEKIQNTAPYLYLGHKLQQAHSSPQMVQFDLPLAPTLVQLQQYLGNINWLRPYIGLSISTLTFLFMALKGLKNPTDVVTLTSDQLLVVEKVQTALNTQWTDRCVDNHPVHLNVIFDRPPTVAITQSNEPTGNCFHSSYDFG